MNSVDPLHNPQYVKYGKAAKHTRIGLPKRLALLIVVALISASTMSISAAENLDSGSLESPKGQAPPARDETGLTLVSASSTGITLTLATPEFEERQSVDDLGPCLQIHVADYLLTSHVGAPSLPNKTTMIGLPPNADTSFEILATESTAWEPTDRLCRNEPPEAPGIGDDSDGFLLDQPEITERGTDHKYQAPFAPVELSEPGQIRSQRVATVQFHPFRYDTVTGDIEHLSRIVARVTFQQPQYQRTTTPIPAENPETEPFETMLANLLVNYDQAKHWRTPSKPETSMDHDALSRLEVESTVPRYRISIETAGVYTITYAQLLAADPTLNQASVLISDLAMSNQGEDVAVDIIGDIDGVLNAGDAILFYGEAVGSKYTSENVYWLTLATHTPLRMTELSGKPEVGTQTESHYTDTLRVEENLVYWARTPSIGNDHWYWDELNAWQPTVTYDFELTGIAKEIATSTLTGLIAGYKVDTQHGVQLLLNGHEVLSATWPAQSMYAFDIAIPTAYLVEGNNSLTTVSGIESVFDSFFTNWFEIQYPRYHRANQETLDYTSWTGKWVSEITDISDDEIDILDITTPQTPTRIMDYAISGSGPSYTVTFQHDNDSPHHYLVTPATHRLAPLAVERVELPELRAIPESIDYVMITHEDFLTATQRLADFHRAKGLSVITVDVENIYNVFNNGIVDPAAIHAFLKYAYENWPRPAPAYVLLVGDGNWDPLNYKGRGEVSYIPPYLGEFDPWMGEAAADNRYVCVSGSDTIPDMHLGRLPVKTAMEANAVVDKIIDYATMPSPSEWRQQLLFVADNPDSAGPFHSLSDDVANQNYVPTPSTSQKVYYGSPTYPEASLARSSVISSINEGRLIVNYVGHGAMGFWAGEKLLTTADLMDLKNDSSRLPFVVPMTCLEGRYTVPSDATQDRSAMAEVFVRLPTTGAIASWSATGLGLASGHDYLNRALFEAIFQKDIIELGPATTYAKLFLWAEKGAAYADLLDTYLLFGDPATKLNVLPVDLRLTKSLATEQTAFTSGDTITYTLTYTNAGPATAHNVQISDTLPTALISPAWASTGATATLQPGTTYSWDIADLPAGTGGVITVTAVITDPFDGTLTNFAEITTTSVNSDTQNTTDQITVDVAQVTTDLQITAMEALQADVDPGLKPGEALTYTIAFENVGPDTARDVVITSTLPALFTPSAAPQTTAGIVVRSGTDYVWDVVDLLPGDTGAITLTGTIARTLYSGPLTHTTTLATSTVDRFANNNTATVTLNLRPEQVYMPVVLRNSNGR